MKKLVLSSLLTLLAAGRMLGDASPSDDVLAAARKLAAQGAYQWVANTQGAPGGGNNNAQARFGPTEGRRDKDGLTCLKLTRGDATTEMIIKGDKGAYKSDSGWQVVDTGDQPAGGGGGGGGGSQPNPGRTAARTLRTFKAPAAEAEELASKSKDLKKEGDTILGVLTEEGAKAMLAFGRRPGGGGPEVSDAKGTVKFWVKEGLLQKYEYTVHGKMSFNGNDREIDRTTTVEIQAPSPTPATIPDDARKLVS